MPPHTTPSPLTLAIAARRPSTITTQHNTRQCTPHRARRAAPLHTTVPLHATLIKRPHRPYTFTQLLTLSDGSSATHRTTSPLPVYRSTKDVRNTPLWNPSNARMAGVEEDEAGRLRAFRARFGRGWDAEAAKAAEEEGEDEEGVEGREGELRTVVDGVEARVEGGMAAPTGARRKDTKAKTEQTKISQESEQDADEWDDAAEENLMDLIGTYGKDSEIKGDFKVESKQQGKGKGKKGGKR